MYKMLFGTILEDQNSKICHQNYFSAADKWKLCAFDDKSMKLGISTIHI